MLGVAGGERLLAMGLSLDEIALKIAYQYEVATGDADFRDALSFFGLPQERRRQFARPQFAAYKGRDPLTVGRCERSARLLRPKRDPGGRPSIEVCFGGDE
jgi:hypothetical protein